MEQWKTYQLRRKNGYCGFSEGYQGPMIIDYCWKDAKYFEEGLAAVKNELDRWGFINANGIEVIPCQWEDVHSFQEGMAAAKIEGKWGFVDLSGTLVIPYQWDSAYDFQDGIAIVRNYRKDTNQSDYMLINQTGKQITDRTWRDIGYFKDGLAPCLSDDEKWGFLNKNGEVAIPCQWEGIRFFSAGLNAVSKEGKWGFIDTTGHLVIPCQWDDAYSFLDCVAPVCRHEKWGVINQFGELIIPCVWEAADFYADRIMLQSEGKYGEIDGDGNWIIKKYNVTMQKIQELKQEQAKLQSSQVYEAADRIAEIEDILSYAVITDEEGMEYPYQFTAKWEENNKKVLASGRCGDNVFWGVEDEILYIAGKGSMENFKGYYEDLGVKRRAPWCCSEFYRVVICEGVTSIGRCAFDSVDIGHIFIPDSVKVIEDWAFFNSSVERLELRDTIKSLGMCIIGADYQNVYTLIISVNIPGKSEAFEKRSGPPHEIILTGTLPTELDSLVNSWLFVLGADEIYYPEEWYTEKESCYYLFLQYRIFYNGRIRKNTV